MILLAALACPAPVPPPPALPDTTRSPYDAPEPPLDGAPAGISEPVRLGLGALDRVDPSNWNAVFSGLAADPMWRLTEYDNAIVAFRRAPGDPCPTVARDGHHHDDAGQWRALLRFTAWDRGLPWAESPWVTRVPSAAATVELPAWSHGDLVATALAVEGLDLSLEVFEAGPGPGRPRTQAAVELVGPLVEGLLAGGAAAPGRDPGVLLRPVGGGIGVCAWTNPGLPGWAWLRLLDARGAPFEEAAVAVATREAVGWSADPAEAFLLQAEIPLPPGPAFRGTAEIWVRPGDATSPDDDRRVGAFPVRVPAR